MMKLIELIRGIATSDATFCADQGVVGETGEDPGGGERLSRIHRNRILMPMINEAIYAHMEGVGTVEAIDEVMKLGMGHPMGH